MAGIKTNTIRETTYRQGEEQRAVKEVLLFSPILVHGEQSKEFESSFATFTSAPNAVSVSSCTAGMHLIYHALGFGP